MIKIAVCDDEEIFLNKIKKILKEIAKNNNIEMVVRTYTNGMELLEKSEDIELFLLDVRMPVISGIDIGHKLRKKHGNCHIAFLTSSKDDAYKGYPIKPLDYIIKPFNYNDILSILEEAMKKTEIEKNSSFLVNIAKSKKQMIEFRDVLYFETRERKLYIICINEEIETIETIKSISRKVENFDMWPAHRSFMVSLWKIKTINDKQVTMMNDIEIPIGRIYKNDFRKAYHKFIINF